mmetsp:Transcript_25724/g.24583  ORF Transcript_25724/g.24583 Transcript_25724/m.24583 type:complete len:167 (+) Transcript_25724:153-653(+)
MAITNYFTLLVVLVSSVVIDGQAPTFAPSIAPTFAPSFNITQSPSGPTIRPTFAPTSTEVIGAGAIAAACIFSIIAAFFVLLLFIYLFRAQKGSSPAQYYFPGYYAFYYPKRQHFVKNKAEVEAVEVERGEDVKKDSTGLPIFQLWKSLDLKTDKKDLTGVIPNVV